ncbi:hypothetical protein CANCADRAFT_22566 [Tortispora caseinolytica NRRL Y-17796]|uniref:Uncharacterized protein n=1 Tax=Tortispora caseinolytica NRRL Y-17796 TaxID=767744 RepID=A0A1E4TJU7_9ASCO|nr:hypothetical protein CANCADRAFT_22566 [Tortispora caseinolytica NRRL Y-17796]
MGQIVARFKHLKSQGATLADPEFSQLARILGEVTRQTNNARIRRTNAKNQLNPGGGAVPPALNAEPPASGPNLAVTQLLTKDELILFRRQIASFRLFSRNMKLPDQVRNQRGLVNQKAQSLHGRGTMTVGSAHNVTAVPSSMGAIAPALIAPAEEVSFKTAKDPYEQFSAPISYENYAERVNKSMIPSVMPVGVDVNELKERRNRAIESRIEYRLQELSSTPTNIGTLDASDVSPSVLDADNNKLKIRALIEYKCLKLRHKQKALRQDASLAFSHLNSFALTGNRVNFRRMKKLSLVESRLAEDLEKQLRIERERKETQKQMEYLQSICSHSIDIYAQGRDKKTRFLRLGKGVNSYHYHTEREEQRRLERTAKQRLQALRANDEETYLKLLSQAKDSRITHILQQTNIFLESLSQAVKEQQADARGVDAEPIDSNENEEGGKLDYYAIAHKIKEEVTKQPNILVGGTLKEYQIRGLQWMVSLYNNNLNGILADEMGLGKTIQTISLITYLIEEKKQQGPYLVIVPLSTITNWTLEFEKWAPSVKKVVYKGPPMARKAQQGIIRSGDFQVCLTTYEYIIKDRPIMSKPKWIYMIIDEGHRLKNTESKLSSTLSQYYHAKHRLILTGTPLQNNLPELWALLNFVLPKIFNSAKSFDEWFNTPFANTGGGDQMTLAEEEALLIIRRLHQVLRPFLLRRLKKDVEKDLPDKVERVVKCKMSAIQSKMYQLILKYNILFVGDSGAPGTRASGLKGLKNQIMQLRKICNHPFVFEEVENMVNPSRITNDYLWRVAGKFELLDRVLPKFKATGHRVLMFFQMTQVMDIMEDFMRLRGWQFLRLDGGTKAEDRSSLLKLFNEPNSPYFCFLLSTRAGGLGLNLQTADTVIIYDTDWNPHQDLQAQDRAHRIGQTKEVRVFRLITEDSVEEMILDRAHQKLNIDGKVIQAGKFDNKSTSEEQEAFLRSLIAADERRGQDDEDDEDLDDEELNELLARSEDEKRIFEQVDDERHATSKYGKGHPHDRLFGEDELPEAYKRDVAEAFTEVEEVTGRGARERKVMHYDDGLTEEQWLDAIDNDEDTIEDAIARKQQRKQRRMANKERRERESETPSRLDDDSQNSDESESITKRKRTPNVSVEPAIKKRRGRPSKANMSVTETLSPEARETLTNLSSDIVESLKSMEEEDTGRQYAYLFLTLPNKRQYPDYYALIKNPIALDTIENRISSRFYQDIDTLKSDLQLMFNNARTYNEEGSMVYEDANIMEAHANELCLKAEEEFSKVLQNSFADEDSDE